MHYEYIPEKVCSKKIEFDIVDNKIKNLKYTGGCNGNLKAISKLVENLEIQDIIDRCKGVKCREKETSCIDQLVKALEEIKLK